MKSMSKSSDQIVLERRLKPIYDAIDAGNNKKAIQEADKVLKKHPNTHCARVLKALALIRSDKVTDAWPLIEEVESEKDDVDENTLQAMCHCFKEAYTPERISALYERVCAKHPKNEQYLTHLFMSYVRIRNYKMQQKTALLLYKEFQRNPYYFWNVMSIVMQAITGEPKLARSMYYPLAEKMVLKMIDSNSIQAEAECDLYCIILEGLEKFDEAANFLENDPLYRRFLQQPSQFTFYRLLTLHHRAGNYMIVVDRCISELKNSADDWNLWCYLFEAAFAHMNLETCTMQERDKLIERLVERVLSLINTAEGLTAKGWIRGPHIARFMLIEKLLESEFVLRSQLGTLSLGEPMDHLVDYVHHFHDKPCCFVDIRPYLRLLGEEQIDSFLEKIGSMVDEMKKSVSTDPNMDGPALRQMEAIKWTEVLHYRLQRALGQHKNMTSFEKRNLANEMILKAQRCSDSSLLAAAYVEISVNLLWDIFSNQDDTSALYELTLLMEYMHSQHPTDPLYMLLLCRFYALIGATAQVQRQMQSLDIKYVQRETLGYLLFGLLEQYGRFNAGIIYYTDLSVLFDQTEKEISECLTTAYKNGNFLKIPRFINFLSSIMKSVIATGTDIQCRALSACFAVDKIQHVVDTLYGDEESIDFTEVVDNRDLDVMPSLEGINHKELVDKEKRFSFYEHVDSMQLRHLLLRSVALIGRSNRTSAQMMTTLTQLEKHHDYCMQQYKQNSPPCKVLQAPPPMYLNSFVHGMHIPLLKLLLTSAVRLVKFSEETEASQTSMRITDDEKLCQILPDPNVFGSLVTRTVDCGNVTINGAFGLHPRLRHCSFALQTLALASISIKLMEIMLETSFSLCIPHKGKKGGRKSSALSRLVELRALVNKGAQTIDAQLTDGQNMLNSDDLIPEISSDYDENVARILLSQKTNADSAIVTCYGCSLNDMRKTVQRVINPPWA